MAARVSLLIPRGLLFSFLLVFFTCQASGSRVPFVSTSSPRHDDFRTVYFAVSNVPTVLYGGPARFGLDLRSAGPVESTVQHVQPLDGCTDLLNNDTLHGHIAIVHRGNCQFAEKALYIQKTGAVGAIVIDYNAGLSSDGFPVFVMGSGTVTQRIRIPLVFLYAVEGNQLLNASNQYPDLVVGISGQVPTSVPMTEQVTEPPTTEEPLTESSVLQAFSRSKDVQQQQLLEKTKAEEESETQLSTLHIALIAGGIVGVLILLAVSLVCWHRSSRKKSGGSPDAIHFSRLHG